MIGIHACMHAWMDGWMDDHPEVDKNIKMSKICPSLWILLEISVFYLLQDDIYIYIYTQTQCIVKF